MIYQQCNMMPIEGTYRWFQIRLVDSTDHITPKTGVTYNQVTVDWASMEGGPVVHPVLTIDDWKEFLTGIYAIRLSGGATGQLGNAGRFYLNITGATFEIDEAIQIELTYARDLKVWLAPNSSSVPADHDKERDGTLLHPADTFEEAKKLIVSAVGPSSPVGLRAGFVRGDYYYASDGWCSDSGDIKRVVNGWILDGMMRMRGNGPWPSQGSDVYGPCQAIDAKAIQIENLYNLLEDLVFRSGPPPAEIVQPDGIFNTQIDDNGYGTILRRSMFVVHPTNDNTGTISVDVGSGGGNLGHPFLYKDLMFGVTASKPTAIYFVLDPLSNGIIEHCKINLVSSGIDAAYGFVRISSGGSADREVLVRRSIIIFRAETSICPVGNINIGSYAPLPYPALSLTRVRFEENLYLRDNGDGTYTPLTEPNQHPSGAVNKDPMPASSIGELFINRFTDIGTLKNLVIT